MSNNPLLEISPLPNHAPQFDEIREEHYLPAIEEAIEVARKNIDAIKNNPEEATFKNTIEALETSSEMLDTITSIFYNQLSACGTDKLQELAEIIGPINSNFSSDILLDEKLFAKVKHVYEQIEKIELSTEEKTLLEDTYKSFVRSGALLDENQKKIIRNINEELSVIGPKFMDNTKKATEKFELYIEDENELSGLPAMAKESAAHAADEKGQTGKYLFTLDFPSYYPILCYADNRKLREKIWNASNSKCFEDEFDNQDNLLKIIELRDKKAKLLGYKNHAHFVLERRMAENPENVWNFLEKLRIKYKESAKKDLEQLQSFAKELDNIDDIKPWDISYYSEKLKEKLFDFSSEELRPYFKLENVLQGCFKHFSKLFDIDFIQAEEKYPTWHKDVVVYDVFDKENNKFLGNLYADFYPRAGKKTGAWKTSYRDTGLYNGKIERPVVSIVCNFTKPTQNTPSLLSFDEVTTLFHEMGHAIHCMLGQGKYQSHTGTNVLWDFVELPSQLMENWCYEQETLNMFAYHYETGENIPNDLVEKLVKSKNFMSGWMGLRQVTLGIIDMSWHTTSPSDIENIEEFEDKATKNCRLLPKIGKPMSVSFNHIFAGGYSAGYYSYKWAEVLDADSFEAFKENGLYDKKTAIKYKKEILERGGNEHPAILYKNFRGRDADPDALLRREGLI